MTRLLRFDGHPATLHASFHGITRDCGDNVIDRVERRVQAAPSMEAYGWRERLWRCTEERCVAWMHRGLELRQRHQSGTVIANIMIIKGRQHIYTI